jgi:hypothetical protein
MGTSRNQPLPAKDVSMSSTEAFNDSTNKATGDSTHTQTSSLAGDIWNSLRQGSASPADRPTVSTYQAIADLGSEFISAGRNSGNGAKEIAHALGITALDKTIDKYHDLKNDYFDKPIGNAFYRASDMLYQAVEKPAANPDANAKPMEPRNEVSVPFVGQIGAGFQESQAMLQGFSLSSPDGRDGIAPTRSELRDLFIKGERQI